MDDNLEFELEVTSVDAAVKQVAAVRKKFGEEVFVTVKIVGDDKSKILSTLNEGLNQTFAQLATKLAKYKEEKL